MEKNEETIREEQARDLIVVKQLPVIEEQLRTIKEMFTREAEKATSLMCTEDSLQIVKQRRAHMTKVYKELEARRINAKKAILAPYEAFETIYKKCVTEIYKPCDEALAAKIREVEDTIKSEKRKIAEDYFAEYAQSKGIDFIPFNHIGVSVTMNASKKSLKDQVKTFLDKVSDELALIETQEHRDEILVEYKNSLNAARAITLVTERHKAIEAEKRRSEAAQAEALARQQAAAKVEEAAQEFAPPKVEVTPPTVESEGEKTYEVSFRVRGTLPKIKALKEFLVNGGYEYVQE